MKKIIATVFLIFTFVLGLNIVSYADDSTDRYSYSKGNYFNVTFSANTGTKWETCHAWFKFDTEVYAVLTPGGNGWNEDNTSYIGHRLVFCSTKPFNTTSYGCDATISGFYNSSATYSNGIYMTKFLNGTIKAPFPTQWSVTDENQIASKLKNNEFVVTEEEPEGYNPKPPIIGPELPENADTLLPMLNYSLKRSTVNMWLSSSQVKETLSWDISGYGVYKDNPNNYAIEIVASAYFKDSPTGIGSKIRDTSNLLMNDNCKISIDTKIPLVPSNYSFMYSDLGKKLYSSCIDTPKPIWSDDCGYTVYIRTYEINGDKKSNWKVYNFALNGYVQQEDLLIDKDGNQIDITETDYDIGNTEHNGSTGGGLDYAPYDPDSSSSASNSPTSALFDSSGIGYTSTLVSTLNSILESLGQIPQLFATIFSFVPSQIITLMSVGFGLIIIVGIVKWIL